jgi:peptidoglycan/xylan/chitin deacetylase (PgdA/CDA1 family)
MTEETLDQPAESPGYAVILMYHRVGIEGALPIEGDYALPSGLFARHARGLSSAGCRVVPLDAVRSGLPPGRSVILTFDDGYDTDEAVALPLLRDLGLPAAFFVSPALVGLPGHLDWPGVRRLSEAGMHVGSHGLDHTLLGGLPEDELARQLSDSRRMLEDHLGQPVGTLSLPGGSGGGQVVRRAIEAGYRLVLGSRPGTVCRPASGEALPRYAVRRGHSPAQVAALAQHDLWPRALARLRYALTQSLRGGLGASTWARLRERLVSAPEASGRGRADR